MGAQHNVVHAGVMIVGDIPKLVGLVDVAMVLFLHIGLCTYIRRIDRIVLFVDEIKMGVIRTRLRLYGKGQHVGIWNTSDQQTSDIPKVIG